MSRDEYQLLMLLNEAESLANEDYEAATLVEDTEDQEAPEVEDL